jgi:hypothetical protein
MSTAVPVDLNTLETSNSVSFASQTAIINGKPVAFVPTMPILHISKGLSVSTALGGKLVSVPLETIASTLTPDPQLSIPTGLPDQLAMLRSAVFPYEEDPPLILLSTVWDYEFSEEDSSDEEISEPAPVFYNKRRVEIPRTFDLIPITPKTSTTPSSILMTTKPYLLPISEATRISNLSEHFETAGVTTYRTSVAASRLKHCQSKGSSCR